MRYFKGYAIIFGRNKMSRDLWTLGLLVALTCAASSYAPDGAAQQQPTRTQQQPTRTPQQSATPQPASMPATVSAPPQTAPPQPDSRAAFMRSLRALCGQSFAGTTDFPTDNPEHPLAGRRLVMRVATCGEREIRIPFAADEDRSRTWILTLTDVGLLFKHDHRHADGTPDEITNYGGYAAAGGTARMQRFPADEHTAQLIPEAATNVWTLQIDPENRRFMYQLERHGQLRYRAYFDLSRPLRNAPE